MLRSEVHGATVIASYGGGVNPTTQGWLCDSASNTYVQASSLVDGDKTVWRLYDPGLARTPSDPNNNLNYNMRPTAGQIQSMTAAGWEISVALRVPENDPTSNIVWVRDSNTSFGMDYKVNPTDANRMGWSFSAGRDANGNTLISVGGMVKS